LAFVNIKESFRGLVWVQPGIFWQWWQEAGDDFQPESVFTIQGERGGCAKMAAGSGKVRRNVNAAGPSMRVPRRAS